MKTTRTPRSTKPAKAQKTSFFCTACGNEQPRWFGHCPACGEWNTASEAPKARGAATSATSAAGAGARSRWLPAGVTRREGAVALADV